MKLNIKYFGVITEIAGKSNDELEIYGKLTISQLIALLITRYPALALVQCKISVNRKIQSIGSITSGDEVAVMPPFSGG